MNSRISRGVAKWLVLALVLGAAVVRAGPPDAPSRGIASAPGYEFVRTSAAADGVPLAPYVSRNAAHALRAAIGAEGVRIQPGIEGTPGWALELRAILLDPADGEPALEGSSFRPAAHRIDYILSESLGIQAWAENGEPGLSFGFVLHPGRAAAEPKREQMRRIAFAFDGDLAAKLSEQTGSLALYAPTGDSVLTVDAVRVADASGSILPAALEMLPGAESWARGFAVAFDAEDGAQPVEISFRISSAARGRSAGKRGGFDSSGATFSASEPVATGEVGPLAASANDVCGGAEVIPANGPFPYLTSVTADVTDATTSDDPPLPSCQPTVSRSIWYEFTPSVTASYTISSCSGATATTATDTVIAVYTSTAACGGAFTQVSGSCDDDSCGATEFNAVSTVVLEAGTTYYVLVWQFGAAPPAVGETAVQLQVSQRMLTPPANDSCTGAEAIPGSGPFPHLTALVADVTDATTSDDPPAPSCQANVSRSIWYEFTPSVRANYTLATCAGEPTGSTALDTVLAVYTSTGGCDGTFSQVGAYCDDDSCLVEEKQSVVSRPLEAGQTYYVLVSQFGTTPPAAGNTAVQLRVGQGLLAANDICSGATALSLNTPLSATTANALDDYELSGAGCFAGVGQTASAAAGRDLTYSFTAPEAGSYSFRVTGYSASLNLVLHVAGECETGAPPILSSSCLSASNRATSLVQGTSNSSEEVMCLPLAALQTVYAVVDENAITGGSPFRVEVTRCDQESSSNESPSQAEPLRCGIEGTISPAAEADFFSLGSRAAGERVFAMVDGVAANSNDFDLRVTSAADTLEYDDGDSDATFGTLAPSIAGTPLTAGLTYLKVEHFSSLRVSEPYRLHAVVQPSSAAATAEVEPNGSLAQASTGANQYFSGALSGSTDQDWFAFAAEPGDLVFLSLDADPLRNGTPINAALALFDPSGVSLLSVNDTNASSSTASGAGSLTLKTPRSPSEGLLYRVTVAGTYAARVTGSSAGDYLLSISRNCKTFPNADLQLAQLDSPDPVSAGQPLTYSLSVSNAGPASARNAVLEDVLPAGVGLTSALPSQGSCSGAGPVICDLGTIASGAGATVEITVIPSSPGTLTNSANVRSESFDPNPANDAASVDTAVQCAPGSGSPNDTTCDGIDDDCDGQVDEDFVSQATACGVGGCAAAGATFCSNAQVQNSCSPGLPSGEVCDGSDNDCNGIVDDGSAAACSDGNACTLVDTCQAGACVGATPVDCDDGNDCTEDECNPSTGLCSNPDAPDGMTCSDGDVCTEGDACQEGDCVGGAYACQPVPTMSAWPRAGLAALVLGLVSLALYRRRAA